MKAILTIACLFLTGLFYAQTNASSVSNVDAATFKKYIDTQAGVLIDLRTNDEIKNKGMIKGAIQIDYLAKDAEAQISGLDKNKTYLIYCAGGGRSGDCAAQMQKEGFKRVINLEKGFDDWKKKGYEVEKRP